MARRGTGDVRDCNTKNLMEMIFRFSLINTAESIVLSRVSGYQARRNPLLSQVHRVHVCKRGDHRTSSKAMFQNGSSCCYIPTTLRTEWPSKYLKRWFHDVPVTNSLVDNTVNLQEIATLLRYSKTTPVSPPRREGKASAPERRDLHALRG